MRTRRLRRAPRGQSIAMAAGVGLISTLMALMTVGLADLTKEKVEAQTAADAAAYSQGIVMARTLNQVGVLNRAYISHMAALLGGVAEVSWGLSSNAAINAAQLSMGDYIINFSLTCAFAGADNPPCGGTSEPACTYNRRDCYCQERNRLLLGEVGLLAAWVQSNTSMEATEMTAGDDLRAMQMAAFSAQTHQIAIWSQATQKLESGEVAQAAIQQVGGGDLTVLSSSTGAINTRETEFSDRCSGDTFACYKRASPLFGVVASNVLGSGAGGREAQFANELENWLGGARGTDEIQVVGTHDVRSAYPDAREARGHSNGFIRYDYGGSGGRCTGYTIGPQTGRSVNFGAYVMTDYRESTSDVGRNWPIGKNVINPDVRITLGNSEPPRGVFPYFYDYNHKNMAKAPEEDIWGQPRLMAAVQRPLVPSANKPWELFFKFNGVEVDMRKPVANSSVQTTVAAACVYYHRTRDWQEPVNFYNPFWRTTLCPWNIDAQGLSDVTTILTGAGQAESATALNALVTGGYRGIP